MVGNMKFCLTLLGGYFIFSDPLKLYQLFGMFLTFCGILVYTHLKIKEHDTPELDIECDLEKDTRYVSRNKL